MVTSHQYIMNIRTTGDTCAYVARGTEHLKEENGGRVVLVGSGLAINKAISVGEILKRNIEHLLQHNWMCNDGNKKDHKGSPISLLKISLAIREDLLDCGNT